LLDILDVQGPPEPVVEFQSRWIGIFSQHTAKQLREFHRVVNSEIQPEPTKRIVHVGGIARKENSTFAECGSDALVNPVDIAMDECIGACLWKEPLQAALRGLFARRLVVGLIDLCWKYHSP
jgi:hypothetical protein